MADINRPRVKSEVYYWSVASLTWVPGTQTTSSGSGGVVQQGSRDPLGTATPWYTKLTDDFDNLIGASNPLDVRLDGFTTQPVSLPTYISSVEFDGSNNPIYIGFAITGSATSATAWQIRKITYTGTNPTSIRFANGTLAFGAVWDDRAALPYS